MKFLLSVLLSLHVHAVAHAGLRPQNSTQSPKSEVTLIELANPKYPPLARQARIIGEVRVRVEVGRGGEIQNVSILQGHPLFAEAVLESARRSRYECLDCPEQGSSVQLTYTFELREANCSDTQSRLDLEASGGVVQSHNAVTVSVIAPCVDHGPPGPNFVRPRARSAKCLSLWRCGSSRAFGMP